MLVSALPRTSRAAVLANYNQPLAIRELTVPPLEPGAILVKLESRQSYTIMRMGGLYT